MMDNESISSSVSRTNVFQRKRRFNLGVKPILISIAVILVLLLAVMVFVVVTQLHGSRSTNKNVKTPKTVIDRLNNPFQPTEDPFYHYDDDSEPVVCKSEECHAAAEYFKKMMNQEADPCEDFNEYVCGGWLKNLKKPYPESQDMFDERGNSIQKEIIESLAKPVVRSPTNAVDNAKAFFQGCMAMEEIPVKEEIHNIKSLISEFTEMPLLGIVRKKKSNWAAQIGKIYRQLNLRVMIKCSPFMHSNRHFSKKYAISCQPAFAEPTTLHPSLYVKNDKQTEKIIVAYKKYLQKALCYISQSRCSKTGTSSVKKEVDNIIDFERNMVIAIGNVSESNAHDFLFLKNHDVLSLKNYSKLYPQIDWKGFLTEMLRSTDVQLTDDTTFMVARNTYFKNLGDFLQSADPKRISSYLTWVIINNFGFTKTLMNMENDFQEEAYGIKPTLLSNSLCYKFLERCMAFALSNIYATKSFQMDVIKEIDELSKDLEKSMKRILEKTEWMDETTRQAAIKKMNKMTYSIGFPKWVMDTKNLNEYYKMKPINRKNMIDSYRILTSHLVKKSLEFLNVKESSDLEWILDFDSPITVNALYNQQNNSIAYCAGLLSPPFVWPNSIKVLNYGAIGFIVGHEITHGFDTTGKQFDDEGYLKDWMSPSSLQHFDQKKNCFVDQYGSITVKEVNRTLNSNHTIGEDIADNGGLREAYAAYFERERPDERLPGFEETTPEQLFFIASASIWCSHVLPEKTVSSIDTDTHTLDKYRSWVPHSNFEKFAEAFHCNAGSKMNPEKRCLVWG